MEGKKERDLDKSKKRALVLPKYYSHVCFEKPAEYSDYSKNFTLSYGYLALYNNSRDRNIDKYEILRKIGRGRYADVYEGVRADDGVHVAIKILRPIKKEKIKREVKILQTLSKSPYISKYVDLVKDPSTKTTSIVINLAKIQ